MGVVDDSSGSRNLILGETRIGTLIIPLIEFVLLFRFWYLHMS